MAKIYETHKDLERDVLKDQAQQLHYQSAVESNTASTGLFAGLLADMWNRGREKKSRIISVVAFTGLAVGIITEIHSWITRGKARDAERELQRLGPGRVVLPPETTVDSGMDLSKIMDKGAKSPLEHAEKTEKADCCPNR